MPASSKKQGIDSVTQQTLATFMATHEAQERAELQMQIRQGRCNIIPMRRTQTRPFRSEIGIERTPIFVSSSFKGDWREYRRVVTDPRTNEPIEQVVRVGRKHKTDRPRGVLQQVHQELFFKLLALWDRAGYPIYAPNDGADCTAMGYLVTSAFELVKFASGGKYNGYRYTRIRSLLADMAAIPIVREHHYLHRDVVDVDEFTLLYGADWTGRNIDRSTGVPLGGGRSEVRIVFSPLVTLGFMRQEHKPLLLGTYLSLGADGRGRRAELARLLYPLLDHELARKPAFHCKLATLAERLGCRVFKYRSQRRQQFQGAVQALNGLPILSEKFRLRLALEESKDSTDWILRASRDGQERLNFQKE